MKLKRLLATLTAVLTIGSLFALTACGGSDDDKTKKPGNDDTNTSEEETLVSEKVTKEQWIAAFSADNFKNVKIEMPFEEKEEFFDKDGNKEDYRNTKDDAVIIVADGVYYYKRQLIEESSFDEDYEEGDEYYYVVEGDLKYTKDDDGKWTKGPAASYDYEENVTDLEESMEYYGTLYDDSTYDTEAGVYVYTVTYEDGEEWFTATIKETYKFIFKDNKIVEIQYEHNYESIHTDEDESYSEISKETGYLKFTFGGQILTLPKVD